MAAFFSSLQQNVRGLHFIFVWIILASDLAPAEVQTTSQSAQYWPDRLIVKFATGSIAGPQRAALQAYSMPAKVAELLAGFGAVGTEQVFPPVQSLLPKNAVASDLSNIYEFRFSRPVNIIKLVQFLRQQNHVVYAEPVYIRKIFYDPNDPNIAIQQHLNRINARQAWDVTQGDTSVVIAIIDTGVDWQHPDLAANIWRNYNELPNNGIDDDGNGYVDDIRGWDFGGLSGTPDNNPREDAADHGTLVAGTASATTDNSVGVAGVGFKCKIMPVKVTQNNRRDASGSPFILYGYQGIVYAAENGADVINCSWGGGAFSHLEQDVIDYATQQGALVVAAAGNEGSSAPGYPAAYRHVLSAAATDNSDLRASFSSYGYWVDVSAPGTNVYGTWQSTTSPYTFLDGTSFSSPIVAGLAALVKSVHKDWKPAQIAEQIRISADDIGNINPNFVRQLGNGRVNAQRAVSLKSPAVRVTRSSFREVVGDGDDFFEANEEVALSLTLTNFLEPVGNLTVTLTENSPYITVLAPTRTVGAISREDTVTVSGTFNFRIAANAPASYIAPFFIEFSAAGYDDWQGLPSIICNFCGDIAAGNVATTVTSIGALGFYDYAAQGTQNLIGRGFEFPKGSASALYHGGLILATASNRVSDVSYGNTSGDRFDFVTTNGGQLKIQPGRKSTVEATAQFTDGAADSPLGLTIDQKAYAWANAPWNDFVILEYTLRNTGTQVVNNLFAGFYLDWDVGDSQNNQAGWDAANQVGYEWEPGSAFYGIAAVFPASARNYRAINNPDFVWDNQLTEALKYQFLTENFAVVSGDTPDDWSQLLSYGPFNVAAGQRVTVAFAVLGGTDLNDLRANAQAARGAYLTTGVDTDPVEPVPLQFALAQNSPNPFTKRAAQATEIRYNLAEPGPVSLRIFNLLGQEVAVLVQRVQNPGNYAVQWDGLSSRGLAMPAGVYFYQLRAPNFSATRKLIVVE